MIRLRGTTAVCRRRLLVLILGALAIAAVRIAAATDGDTPSSSDQRGPAASFAYVEPIRRAHVVAYVVRVHGVAPVGEVKVRVREVAEGGGRGEVVYGSARGHRTPVRADGAAPPGPAADGRPWPLRFAEPPPGGARDREFRVDLFVNGVVTIQRLTISAAGPRWRTSSGRISLVGRPGDLDPPLAFKEAHEQSDFVERLLTGRIPILATAALLLIGLGLAVHWAPREVRTERPSPEQRGAEGRGLLVMLIVVVVASGAMLIRHLTER